jgi:hypothetical protein
MRFTKERAKVVPSFPKAESPAKRREMTEEADFFEMKSQGFR